MFQRKNKPVGARPIVLPPEAKSSSGARARRSFDYKDRKMLAGFLSDGGKILPRRVSGLSLHEQKDLKKAIKRARILAILPFVKKYEDK